MNVSKEISDKWYSRRLWRDKLRPACIRRDPVCVLCQRSYSTIADHRIPHRGDWNLFNDLDNLQGLCKECHDRKTAAEDGGFGHVQKKAPGGVIVMTREGIPFVASSLTQATLNKAIGTPEEIEELLGNL